MIFMTKARAWLGRRVVRVHFWPIQNFGHRIFGHRFDVPHKDKLKALAKTAPPTEYVTIWA
jgi:hypothetical protein